MADNVIKEFLVSLGFKVEGQDKFDKGLDAATAKAVAMGEAIYDLAKQVAEAMARILPDLDQLYWQTQRLGSSAADIRAYGYAMSQLGGSAKGASAALESIAEFVKSSPGAAGWLTGRLGVDPRNIHDAQAVAQDLAKAFQRMPYYQAKAYASVLGIDPIQLQAMTRDTGVFEDQYRQMAQRLGIDLDSLAGKSNDAMTRVRELKEEMSLAFDVAEYKALEWLMPKLEQFSRWVNEIMSGKKLTGIGGDLQALIADVKELFGALGELAATPYMQNFADKMLKAIGEALKGLSALARMVTHVLNGEWAAAAHDAWDVVTHASGLLDNLADAAFGGGADQYRQGVPATQEGGGVAAPVSPTTGGVGSRSGGATRADRNNNPGNIQAIYKGRLVQWVANLPGYVGHDGRFAIFSNAEAGMNAQLMLLRKYMRRGWDTIGEIVSHWAPSSENNTRAYIARVSKMVGMNPNAPLMETDLSRIASAMAAVEGYKGGRGHGGGVVINQHNQFHAHGGNSKDVTQGVLSQQEAANQRLVSSAGVFAY